MRRILLIALAACVAVSALAGPALAGDTAIVSPPTIFASKLEKVRTTSGLDVYLPSKLRVYTTAKRAKGTATAADGTYDLELGIGRCNGANVCSLANFTGFRGEKPAYTTKVKLFGGRTGYFKPLTCGASCSPPAVQWLEGDVLYEIAAKGSTAHKEKATLVKLADSAIKAGPR
jgi:hypothetical protein